MPCRVEPGSGAGVEEGAERRREYARRVLRARLFYRANAGGARRPTELRAESAMASARVSRRARARKESQQGVTHLPDERNIHHHGHMIAPATR